MRVAIVSTFPPRACGIATFAADVRRSLATNEAVSSVISVPVVEGPPSTDASVVEIEQAALPSYADAARSLDDLRPDVVVVQHEYGIYGGADGEYVLAFADQVAQPMVVTLHTVLSRPSRGQARVLAALCDSAARVVVMTETAKRLLVAGGACEVAKIRVVPHGAPPVLARRASEVVARLQAGDALERSDRGCRRFVLSTFGLLSTGKGIETMIAAMPAILETHPELVYIVAGQTHPEVAKRDGEHYRLSLEALTRRLGLANHVQFDDRFLSIEEIADLLAVTDVFVTPYRELEQISSGALTFGIAAGCAVVSTPYWYAKDVLASGAGTIVPFADVAALSNAILGYLNDPALLKAAREEARRGASRLAWPAVAAATVEVLREAADRTSPGLMFANDLVGLAS